uniref:Uncharacterized protein n=1 Tax=Arion vulgaris TaxID=1028688 RepID=A0A0B6YPZ7_9EUPU
MFDTHHKYCCLCQQPLVCLFEGLRCDYFVNVYLNALPPVSSIDNKCKYFNFEVSQSANLSSLN